MITSFFARQSLSLRVLSASLLASVALGITFWRYQPGGGWFRPATHVENPTDWLGI